MVHYYPNKVMIEALGVGPVEYEFIPANAVRHVLLNVEKVNRLLVLKVLAAPMPPAFKFALNDKRRALLTISSENVDYSFDEAHSQLHFSGWSV